MAAVLVFLEKIMIKQNKLKTLFVIFVILFSIAIAYKSIKANVGFSKTNIIFSGLER
jgi:hypothetical protein